jgi:hypothetical protein
VGAAHHIRRRSPKGSLGDDIHNSHSNRLFYYSRRAQPDASHEGVVQIQNADCEALQNPLEDALLKTVSHYYWLVEDTTTGAIVLE